MVSATLRRQATHVQCALGSLGGGIRDEAARSVAKRGALRVGSVMTQEADRMHATLLAYEAGSAGRHEQHLSCVSITRKDSDGSHMRCTTRCVQRGGFQGQKAPRRVRR